MLSLLLPILALSSSFALPSPPPYNTTIYPNVIPPNATKANCKPARLDNVEFTYSSDSTTNIKTTSSKEFSISQPYSPYIYYYDLYRSDCTGSLSLKLTYQKIENTTCTIVANSVPISICTNSSIPLPIDYNSSSLEPGFNSYSIELNRSTCRDVHTVIQPVSGPDVVIPGIGLQGTNMNISSENTKPLVIATQGHPGSADGVGARGSGTATNDGTIPINGNSPSSSSRIGILGIVMMVGAATLSL